MVEVLKGIFYLLDGEMMIEGDKVADKLRPFVGKEVKITAHHDPPLPLKEEEWGAGCCFWEPAGKCPVGHHADPQYLMVFPVTEGVFEEKNGCWFVGDKKVPIGDLEGHLGMVIVVGPLPDGNINAVGSLRKMMSVAEALTRNTTNLMEMLKKK